MLKQINQVSECKRVFIIIKGVEFIDKIQHNKHLIYRSLFVYLLLLDKLHEFY